MEFKLTNTSLKKFLWISIALIRNAANVTKDTIRKKTYNQRQQLGSHHGPESLDAEAEQTEHHALVVAASCDHDNHQANCRHN